MQNLGLSPAAVQKILQDRDWVEKYRTRLTDLCKSPPNSDFLDRYFVNFVKEPLQKSLQKGSDKVDFRETIQRWWLISDHKAEGLMRLILLISDEFSVLRDIKAQYDGVPFGLIHAEAVAKMSKEELDRWRECSTVVSFANRTVTNLLGLYVSEAFFTLEAMARTVCIGSCFEFALKSVLPDVTVQHDSVHKTLLRLSKQQKDSVVCRLCTLNDICVSNNFYSQFARIYELFYHLRVVKDYRLDFYFERELIPFLLEEYLSKTFKVICEFDKVLNRLYRDYMESPISLSERQELVLKAFEQITPNLQSANKSDSQQI